MPEITYRPVTDDEYPAFARAFVEGFSDDLSDEGFANLIKSTLPAERTLAAFDGDEIVGTFGGYALDLTIPGGVIPMEGTTVVTVFPTHRRMGLMTEMMRRHLDTAVDNGYAIAGLWAADSDVYGRFGYGIAAHHHELKMRGPDIGFRDSIDIDRVRRISVDVARVELPPVFEAVLAITPGMYARTPEWWAAEVFHESDWRKKGRTSLRIAVHDGDDGIDGYVIYRQKAAWKDGHGNGAVHVIEQMALTDRAHVSLWSYVLNVDGCPNVESWNVSIDDPLPMKVREPRRLRIAERSDSLWIAVLDVVVALEARTYERDGTIRFSVENAFRSDAEGTYELSVVDGVGSCARVDGDADVDIDLDVLGALFLGGGETHAYAAASRIRGDADGVAMMHDLFRTTRAPWCNQVF